MSSFFSGNLEKKHFVEANKQICDQSNEPFGLDGEEELEQIISRITAFDSIPNKKERIIKKITSIIGGLAYEQPFKNGNKRTALSISILYLRINGFDLPYIKKEQQREIFDLLEGLMYKFERDDIYSEVEEFLRKRIIED